MQLQYTHLSSISQLPEQAESDSSIAFQLAQSEVQSALTVTVKNFPTEAIYKHLAFYWPVALANIKRRLEARGA